MTTDYKNACEEMMTALNAAFTTSCSTILGYTPFVIWPGFNIEESLDESKFNFRVSFQEIVNNQKTLCENVVTLGSRRFESYGLVFVQIFAPKRNNARNISLQLAKEILKTIRQRTQNVILRNASIKELPLENGCVRINVNAEYEFDEVS